MKTPVKITLAAGIVVVVCIVYFLIEGNIQKAPMKLPVQNPNITVPASYKSDNNYTYQTVDPSKPTTGIKFTIPESVATGTNLAADSYISLEQVISSSTCSADLFISRGTPSILNDSGVTYSFASSSDAGAGNRYEESVYALPNSNPCIAIRYFIHYGAFENYPTGSIKKFDKEALIHEFDGIRRSLTY